MPHKRNPIISERITGLARVLRGYAQAGPRERRPLARARHLALRRRARDPARRDDRCSTTCSTWPTRVVEGMTVHADRMRENLELTHGALFSQRALTALVEAGMSRDDAYRLVQESGPARLGRAERRSAS